MRRGQRVRVHRTLGTERYVAESFAAIYVVVVWFDDAFDLKDVEAKVHEALPEIEAIVLAMPPFDGPRRSNPLRLLR